MADIYNDLDRQSSSYTLLKDGRQGPAYGTVHRGIVVDNADPSGTGRIKAWVPSLYPSLTPVGDNADPADVELLPWALPCFPTASYNSGSFTIPQNGDIVWILFESNDIFRPVYMGCMYTSGSDTASPVGGGIAPAYENYTPQEALNPNHYIVNKTPGGSGIWMNDENQTAYMYSGNGGSLEMGEDGVSLSYGKGGSIYSQDGTVEMVSPAGSRIGATDTGEDGKTIYLTTGKQEIKITDGKKIEIFFDKDKNITVEEDHIKIGFSGHRYIDMTDESIYAQWGSSHIELYEDDVVVRSTNTINLKADGTINLDASEVLVNGVPIP